MQGRQVWTHYTPDMYYGYGIINEEYKGLELLQHGGNVPGWGAILLWVPERRFAVAVLANGNDSLTSAAYCVADTTLDLGYFQPPDYSTDPSTWDAYLGGYQGRDTAGSEFEAEVSWSSSTALLVNFIDHMAPDQAESYPLIQLVHDTFGIDVDDDGVSDTDVTFIAGSSSPQIVWLRNRYFVGLHYPQVRRGLGRVQP
jgi:hypothetical protein